MIQIPDGFYRPPSSTSNMHAARPVRGPRSGFLPQNGADEVRAVTVL